MAKSLNYLNKNFQEFNDTLVQYIKDRFPNEYTDITQSNPGQIFIDQAAYVGSILSFYLDNQLQNILPQHTNDIRSLLSYAYVQGYPILPTTTSIVEITIEQLVPAISVLGEFKPDYNYAIVIPANTLVASSASSLTFLSNSIVDFSFSTPTDPTSVRIYSYNSSNEPEMYVLTKTFKAVSGTRKSVSINFTNPTRFASSEITDTNILFIQDVTDSDGNTWYEVPYLGQNTIFKATKNVNSDKDTVKYIIGVENVTKRFVSRFKNANTLELEFGSGIYDTADVQIVPTVESIRNSTDGYSNTYNPLNPHTYLYTKEYGEAPAHTTLTFNYIIGGGIQSNVPSNTITNIDTTDITFNGIVDPVISAFILQNISVNNKNSATGGRNTLSLKEIKNTLIANFAAQDRAINTEDYTVRCLSLPSKYGVVAKAFIQNGNMDNRVINVSTLSYDKDGKFTPTSPTLKSNLYTYLDNYKAIGDKPIITDAFIINISLEFEITIHENYIPKEVLLNSINKLKEYFEKENWQINQPIIKSDILYQLSIVEGVQSVVSVNINNKSGGSYSSIVYDIAMATKNNIIYPSIDPSIFEVKFPETDIVGRIKII